MKIFTKKIYARFLIKGGVTSPGYLLQVLKTAKGLGKKYFHLGSRQDILIKINRQEINTIEDNLHQLDLKIVFKNINAKSEQNIVSSYVASDILPSTSWVTSGTYLKILDSFDFMPKIKVNIIDPKQNLVPLFYGTLNFIASTKEHYWYLRIRKVENGNIENWPVLVYSTDIPILSKAIEGYIGSHSILEIKGMFEIVCNTMQLNNSNIQEELNYSDGFFPEYEGIYRMPSGNKFWAGFYWRNNHYTIEFLEEVCQLCLRTDISKISFTPWKTFLIKDIKEPDLILWERLIGKFGINMRHSAFELNWHLPLLSKGALNLKKYIVKKFDKVDVRTYGLTFGVAKGRDNWMTSIVIKDKGPFTSHFFSFFNRYDIYYTKDFNPNTNEYEIASHNCPKVGIAEILIDLSKKYYQLLNTVKLSPKENHNTSIRQKNKEKKVYQCNKCFTVYDKDFGDIMSGIPALIPFEHLPENYSCYTCGNEKDDFSVVTIKENVFK